MTDTTAKPRTYSLSTRYILTGIFLMALAVIPYTFLRQQMAIMDHEMAVFNEAAGMDLDRPWEFHEDTHYRLAACLGAFMATVATGVPGFLLTVVAAIVKFFRRKRPPRIVQPFWPYWWGLPLLLIAIALFFISGAISISRNSHLLTIDEIDQERATIRALIAAKQTTQPSTQASPQFTE